MANAIVKKMNRTKADTLETGAVDTKGPNAKDTVNTNNSVNNNSWQQPVGSFQETSDFHLFRFAALTPQERIMWLMETFDLMSPFLPLKDQVEQ